MQPRAELTRRFTAGLLTATILIGIGATATNAVSPANRHRVVPTAVKPGVSHPRSIKQRSPRQPFSAVNPAATWTWMEGPWTYQYEPDCVTGGVTFHNAYAGYYGATDGSGPLTNTVYYMNIGFSVGGGCAGGVAGSLWAWMPPGTTVTPSTQYPVRCMWDALDGQGFREITGSAFSDCKANPQKDASGKYYFGTAQIPNFTMYEVWIPVTSTQRLIGSAGSNGGHKIQAEVMIGTANPMTVNPKGWIWVSDGTVSQPQISVSYPDTAVTDLTCVAAKTTGYVYNQFTAGSAYIDLGRDGHGFEASAGPIAISNAESAYSVFTNWNLGSEQTYRWRVRYVSGGQTVTGAEKTFTTKDCIAPTGSVSINADAASTTSSTVSLGISATDGTGVTQMRLSNDGANWSAWEAFAATKGWTLTAGTGARTVSAQFRDAAGNVSAAAQDSITVSAPPAGDTTPPVAAVPTVAIGASLGTTTVPVKVSWAAATDANGITSYELQQSVAGGAWTAVALAAPTARSQSVSLTPGKATQFRVRAFDPSNNPSGWATGSAITATLRQEAVAGVTYTGTWKLAALTGASGGKVKFSVATGARVSTSVTGKSVAIVAARGKDRGKAAIYIDGVLKATVDLYSATTKVRQVVYSSALAAGAHTVQVKVLGTKNAASSGKRVDLDAIVILG